MSDNNAVRLDRWLWAVRFFKTRSMAVAAIKRGRITVNGQKAKPARHISSGDTLRIRKAQFIYELTVIAVSDKRLSARLAVALYSETPDSITTREQRELEIKADRQSWVNGRPNKKDRRIQQAIKRQPRDPGKA